MKGISAKISYHHRYHHLGRDTITPATTKPVNPNACHRHLSSELAKIGNCDVTCYWQISFNGQEIPQKWPHLLIPYQKLLATHLDGELDIINLN